MSKAVYRDIPGAADLSGGKSGGRKEKKPLSIASKITLSVLVCAVLAFLFLMLTMSRGLLVINWMWIGIIISGVMLTCLAVLLMLGLRRIAKTNWSRLGFTCLMVIVLSFCVIGTWAIATLFYETAEVPVSYHTDDKGHRVVVMRSSIMTEQPDANGHFPTQYTMYQTCRGILYLDDPMKGEATSVYTLENDHPNLLLDWTEDGQARLYLPDYAGQEHSELYVYLYDFDNMEASVDAHSELNASATPTPTPLQPAPKPTPGPTADPFAYTELATASEPAAE